MGKSLLVFAFGLLLAFAFCWDVSHVRHRRKGATMNVDDDRLKIAPPGCCLSCAKLDKWERIVTVRYRCSEGHPMHEPCGFYRARPLGAEADPDRSY